MTLDEEGPFVDDGVLAVDRLVIAAEGDLGDRRMRIAESESGVDKGGEAGWGPSGTAVRIR